MQLKTQNTMKKQLILVLLFPIIALAQQPLRRADAKFEQEAYISAIKIYEHLANRGKGTAEIYEKLADANYFNANYIQAQKWYEKRYALQAPFSEGFLYRYSQTLKSAGMLEQAKKIMVEYAKDKPAELRVRNQTPSLKAQNSIKKGSDGFSVVNLAINSKYADFSSFIKGDTLLFASSRPRIIANQIYERTGQAFTNLYYSVKANDTTNTYGEPKLFSKKVFSVYHEATPIFTKDGKTMYYTQNEVKENHKRKLINGLNKIYKATYENGKWIDQGVLDIFALDSIRVAHPALSPDESTLYFASDAKGSYGQSDLYKIELHPDGTIGNPVNLGSAINTEARESYPFVTEDNILLFASDGRLGMGGFDIYAIDLTIPNAIPVHLGSPINSPFDDFGINWDRTTNQGVFSSNRPGGKGDDDLYSFQNTGTPFVFEYVTNIKGKVVDITNSNPLAQSEVVLLDKDNKEVAKTIADENGNFGFENVTSNAVYTIQISKINYSSAAIEIVARLYGDTINKDIQLQKDTYEIAPGLDLAKVFQINQIYFDLDQSTIRKDAIASLDKIVQVLEEYPTIKLEIGSHTDSRQHRKYNKLLSQRRAEATMAYLVNKGIDQKRLTAKGYGESQLINPCADAVPCTEAQHQQNRRSSFVISASSENKKE
jgi:outer membrane protein OmpA-like peptidoglycan-associated protein